MMRHLVVVFAMLSVGVPAIAHAQSARAQLKDAQANVVGTATLSEGAGGVRVTLRVNGLKPGEHGFHIHAVGKCEPPDFTSAGPHFNPYGKHHGLVNPAGPHAGDFQNLQVRADGTGELQTTDSLVTLVTLKDGPNSVFPPGGTSLIIHLDPDDEKTDPAGTQAPGWPAASSSVDRRHASPPNVSPRRTLVVRYRYLFEDTMGKGWSWSPMLVRCSFAPVRPYVQRVCSPGRSQTGPLRS